MNSNEGLPAPGDLDFCRSHHNGTLPGLPLRAVGNRKLEVGVLAFHLDTKAEYGIQRSQNVYYT